MASYINRLLPAFSRSVAPSFAASCRNQNLFNTANRVYSVRCFSCEGGLSGYTKSHEYLKVQGKDGDVATLGITKVAVDHLEEVAFVELPSVAAEVHKGEVFATVESVKAVGEVYSPVDGEVIEVNSGLSADPKPINADPEGAGWFVKVKMSSEKGVPSDMLNKADYDAVCAAEAEASH